MPTVSELMARNISNAVTNVKTWSMLYNVKDVGGAKGDGESDDTTAIQSTIDTAYTDGGGAVFVPPGTYMITEPLVLKSGVSFIGFHSSVTIIKLADNSSAGSMIYNQSGHGDISVENITFDGNWLNNIDYGSPTAQGNYDGGEHGILVLVVFQYATDITIKDCKIKNAWNSGLWFNDVERAKILHNTVYDCRSVGISFRADTSSATYEGGKFIIDGNEVYNCTVGIQPIFGTYFGTISNNICYENRDTRRFPSWSFSGTYPNVYPLNDPIFNNSSDPDYVSPALVGDGSGIELTTSNNAVGVISNEHIAITGNVCERNEQGIRIEGYSRFVTISGNVCSFNYTNGIFIYDANRIAIVGNTVARNEKRGIRLERVAGRAAISESVINGNNIHSNGEWGLTTYGATVININGNVISGNNYNDVAGLGEMLVEAYDSQYLRYSIIANNLFVNSDGRADIGIKFDVPNTHSANTLQGNVFRGYSTATDVYYQFNQVVDNVGYSTSNTGSATITTGTNIVAVTHGLPFTPFQGQIQVTPVGDIGSGNRFWITNVTSTTFDIRVASNLASNVEFYWQIIEARNVN